MKEQDQVVPRRRDELQRKMNSTDDVFADFVTSPPPPLSPHWGLLALFVIPVWIVAGNSLVLLALLLQRHLQNMSNRVIASLAVTDFLLALVVVPLSIYQLVRTSL